MPTGLETEREGTDVRILRRTARPEIITDPDDRPRAVRRVGDAVYARTDCPSCGAPMDPLPKAKKRCPSCGEAVYVRSGPDGRRYLLAERDLEAHEARWEAEHEATEAREAAHINREAARLTRAALVDYAAAGVRHLEMSKALPGVCPACEAVAGRRFAVTDAPPIPVAGCSNAYCRCGYLPVVD